MDETAAEPLAALGDRDRCTAGGTDAQHYENRQGQEYHTHAPSFPVAGAECKPSRGEACGPQKKKTRHPRERGRVNGEK